jgi:hypothetical protein
LVLFSCQLLVATTPVIACGPNKGVAFHALHKLFLTRRWLDRLPVPQGFPHFATVMDGWGAAMLAALEAVAELAALGFGLPQDAFVSRMRGGPHLLAPTGSDLGAHGQLGQVYAGCGVNCRPCYVCL